MNKRLSALMAAGLLAVACLSGCGDNKTTTTVIRSDTPGNASVAEKKELPPGEEFTANKNEEYNYEKLGLKITFSELALTSDVPDSEGKYTYAMLFTAVNNGSEMADIRMLDDFSLEVDGKPYEESIFTALSAANGQLAYKGTDRYDSRLEPGQTVTGFVPFSIDTVDWKTLTVIYSPDLSRSNDTIKYTVDRAELVNKF